MPKRNERDSLRRGRAFRPPLPRILIVCEGTQTEPDYFREIRHLEKSVIQLEISPGGEPKALVDRAVEIKRAAERTAKSKGDPNLRFNQVWCVFDVDDHRLIPEAKEQARANGIELAISHPCFELWALLHFRDHRAYIARDVLHHECKKYMPGYDKKLPTARLHPLLGDALRRAAELDKWQDSRGLSGDNPSTGVYRLMEQIRRK